MLTTRSKVSIVALAAAAGLAACGDSRSTESAQLELQRDLQLASASTMNLAGGQVDSALLVSMETKPQAAPETATTVRRGSGPRAVESDEPTVEATPDVDVAAVEVSEEVQTEDIAPSPEPTNEPVAIAPRPAPVVIQTGGAGDYGVGNGGGVFGGGGGRGGVVIRGGGVDGDNCELHRNGRRGGTMSSPPIYIPVPNYPRTGGVSVRPRTVGSGSTASPRTPTVGTARPTMRASTMQARSRIR